MRAPGRKLTVAGIVAAVAAAASQGDSIVSAIEKHFGASPYLFVVASYRYELIFVIVSAAIAYYLYDGGFLETYPRLRMNWVTRPVARLHPEEWAVLTVVLALGCSLLVHSYFKATSIYQAYGLQYVAEKLCTGDFDEALARMKALKANPLWEKYRGELQAAIDRNTYVKELLDRRLANFTRDRERDSAENLLAQAIELKLIFGSNAWRTLDVRQAPAATEQWRRFLAGLKC